MKVSAQSGEINSETYPAWATITYEFPARGNLPPVKLTWYEGAKDGKRNLPPKRLFPDSGSSHPTSGSLLMGSKWRMYSPNDYGAVQMLWPVGEYKILRLPDRTLPRIEGVRGTDDAQKLEWVQAIRAGKPSLALSNFDYASTLDRVDAAGQCRRSVRPGHRIQPGNRRDRRQLVGVAISQALFPQGLGDLSDAHGRGGVSPVLGKGRRSRQAPPDLFAVCRVLGNARVSDHDEAIRNSADAELNRSVAKRMYSSTSAAQRLLDQMEPTSHACP